MPFIFLPSLYSPFPSPLIYPFLPNFLSLVFFSILYFFPSSPVLFSFILPFVTNYFFLLCFFFFHYGFLPFVASVLFPLYLAFLYIVSLPLFSCISKRSFFPSFLIDLVCFFFPSSKPSLFHYRPSVLLFIRILHHRLPSSSPTQPPILFTNHACYPLLSISFHPIAAHPILFFFMAYLLFHMTIFFSISFSSSPFSFQSYFPFSSHFVCSPS